MKKYLILLTTILILLCCFSMNAFAVESNISLDLMNRLGDGDAFTSTNVVSINNVSPLYISPSATSINDSSVFLKQPNGSVTCTLYSNAMMLRRAAILNNNSNWSSITADGMMPYVWSGVMLNHYTYAGFTGDSEYFSSNKSSEIISLLKAHPEGIVAYDKNIPHAVLLTDYDSSTGILYCADPSSYAPSGRIPITQSSLNMYYGYSQSTLINAFDCYWYVSSASGTHTHNYTAIGYEGAHPHRQYKYCSSCGKSAPSPNTYTGNITYFANCAQCKAIGAPKNVKVSQNGNDVTVTWNKTSYTSYYNVYLVQSPWRWADIKYTGKATSTSYTFKNVANGSYRAFVISRPNLDQTQSSWVTVNVPSIKAPSISSSGSYIGGQRVKITNNQAGATIYYTTDGTTPTTSSPKYTGEFNISASATVKAIAVMNGQKSAVQSKTFTVSQVVSPKLTKTLLADAAQITLSSTTPGATIYYTTDGSEPSTSSKKYAGSFNIKSSATINAIAVKSGYRNSAVLYQTVTIGVPAAPTISATTNTVLPQGKIATISWKTVSDTNQYVATLYQNGSPVKSVKTTGLQASFVLEDVGEYSVSVTADNFVGSSKPSNSINFSAKAPCVVNYVDWDGTVLSSQQIEYGGNAVVPATPAREGHTFTAWDKGNTNITENTTITALYKAEIYTVKFIDSDDTVLKTEKVEYGTSAVPPEDPAPKEIGYVFMGWRVQSGNGDIDNVKSAMTLIAVYQWGNKDLPIITNITKAQRNAGATGYDVDFSLTNYPEKSTKVRIIVSLKTSQGKMVATETSTATLAAGQTNNFSRFISYDGSASVAAAEISVMGVDGNDRTGGVIAETVSKETALEDVWSEWTTEIPSGVDPSQVQSRTEYRYRDKSTTTSSSSSLEGWTNDGYSTSYGSWSAWSKTKVTASSTVQVETKNVAATYKTQYHYKRYKYWHPSYGWMFSYSNEYANYYGYSGSWQYCHTYTQLPYYTTYDYACYGYSNDYYWPANVNNLGSYTAFTTKVVNVAAHTQYRWRSINKTYNYYKWSDWSEWSASNVTASSAREVETRTTYRYNTNVTNPTEEDNTGNIYTISGNVVSDADLSGKRASILVYKGLNSDPTESQLQYVGQITLGENNSYTFTVIPKEIPSVQTGDFIVTLGVEGSTNLMDIDVIEAPSVKYEVSFMDSNGNLIEKQSVKVGASATAPDAPDKEGHIFTGWSESFANIQEDLVVHAQYEPKTYAVAYVDWENDTIEMKEYLYGDTLTYPTPESVEKMIFKGWDAELNGITTVSKNMVVTAQYEGEKFDVIFTDWDMKPIDIQEVEYGKSADPPVLEDTETNSFVGWEKDVNWWEVKDNIIVTPIISYKNSVESPTVDLEPGTYSDYEPQRVVLETETENAEIYYTVDGSDPTPESEKYTAPLELTEDTEIKAIAFAANQNPSSVVTLFYSVTVLEDSGGDLPPIEEGPILVESIGLEQEYLTLNIGSSNSLVAHINPIDATDKTIIWRSSDDSIVKVSETGTVTSVKEGNVVITASTPDGSVSASCEVYSLDLTSESPVYIDVENVTLDKSDLTLEIGKTETLNYDIIPANATIQTVIWESSDTSVVSVENGKVTALKPGIAVIKAITVSGSKEAICNVTVTEKTPDIVFTDVPSDAYYADAVSWAVANGVTSGMTATTFGPDLACTRGQAVTFLWRAAGSPEPQSSYNPFTDVKSDQYYYKAVLWAVEKGITNGMSATSFGPDITCNRAQIVTFLYRAEGSPDVAVRDTFSDVATDAYYAKAVTWAVDKGITTGTSATTFSPDANCIRAQIVTFLYRANQ